MMRRRLTWCGILLLAGIPLLALSESEPEKLAHNQARLAELRKQPEAYAALIQEAQDFLSLSEQHRDRLRKLDHDLYSLPAAKRVLLLDVLKRYTVWLARLPEVQRRRIEQAPDRPARLETIRQVREEQWLQTLPRATREQLARLPGEPRRQQINKLHLEEKKWKAKWRLAFNHWQDLVKERRLPARLKDLPAEIQTFVKEYLYPRLSDEEKKRLEKAEGHWPLYPCTLVDIADRHPVALPSERGPKYVAQLPLEVQEKFRRAKVPLAPLRKVEGKPEFAKAVTELARQKKILLPNELWPTQLEDLSQPVREFVLDRLRPVLSQAEKTQLKDAEGLWPRFPLTLRWLARQHDLQVPWQTLPPPRGQTWTWWNSYRVKHYELVGQW